MPCIYLGALVALLFPPQRPRSALNFPQRVCNRWCRLCISMCQNPRKPVQNHRRAWVFALTQIAPPPLLAPHSTHRYHNIHDSCSRGRNVTLAVIWRMMA